MVAPILIAAALNGPVNGAIAERVAIEQFIGNLCQVRSGLRTLHITFELSRPNDPFQKTDRYDGTLLVLNDGGTIYGVLQFVRAGDASQKESWVLRGEDLYSYDHTARTVRKLASAKDGAFRYIARYGWGAVWLLDPAEARKRCDIRLMKRDAYYNYFTVKVSQPAWGPLFLDLPDKPVTHEYRFATLRKESDGLAAGAICQIARVPPDGGYDVYKIKSWTSDGGKSTATRSGEPARWLEVTSVNQDGVPISPLTRRDEPPAVASLAAAFANYLLLALLCPDAHQRPRVIAAFCRYLFRMSVRCNSVFGTADRSAVVCAWPPGWEWPARWTSLRNGGVSFLWRLGLRGARLLARIERELDVARARYVPGPHWYVPLLGVRPEAQGRGLSRAVLRPVFEAADRDRVPVYLETATESNVAIYQKLGFDLRGHRELTGGLPNWEFVREPRGDQSPVASMAAV